MNKGENFVRSATPSVAVGAVFVVGAGATMHEVKNPIIPSTRRSLRPAVTSKKISRYTVCATVSFGGVWVPVSGMSWGAGFPLPLNGIGGIGRAGGVCAGGSGLLTTTGSKLWLLRGALLRG